MHPLLWITPVTAGAGAWTGLAAEQQPHQYIFCLLPAKAALKEEEVLNGRKCSSELPDLGVFTWRTERCRGPELSNSQETIHAGRDNNAFQVSRFLNSCACLKLG